MFVYEGKEDPRIEERKYDPLTTNEGPYDKIQWD